VNLSTPLAVYLAINGMKAYAHDIVAKIQTHGVRRISGS
jgi:hypothetical protein